MFVFGCFLFFKFFFCSWKETCYVQGGGSKDAKAAFPEGSVGSAWRSERTRPVSCQVRPLLQPGSPHRRPRPSGTPPHPPPHAKVFLPRWVPLGLPTGGSSGAVHAALSCGRKVNRPDGFTQGSQQDLRFGAWRPGAASPFR